MSEMPSSGDNDNHRLLLKQALRALEQMKQKMGAIEQRAVQPVAIIGIGCRFPGGVNDTTSFWELLESKREAITEVPTNRWDIDSYYDPDSTKPGKMVSRYGGFLTDVDQFDAQFFGIAPREAAMMDPQQRLLLEVTWEALEHAAIAPSTLAGTKTGMYVGMASGDYAQMQLQAKDAGLLDVHYASGNAHSIASGRISYLLGLKGPSLAVDTACSSSLVAIDLACQALRSGDCTTAIAGGVNVILAPETTVALSQAHMLAPDGKCKVFDDLADGFTRAEGCGIVILKNLDAALHAGDRILAVIRGSAVNQDGASSSLTAPHGPSQEALMRDALREASIEAADIGYIESHGTGTALGDPIELRALGSVYGASRPAGKPVHVGSLKTNLGHMEAAAGVGGLIKLVLALEHSSIPPNLHFETPTSHVNWNDVNLAVPVTPLPWPARNHDGGPLIPRVGAISSFGFSGTNVHLVVEQAPAAGAVKRKSLGGNDRIPRILPLSAQTSEGLFDLAQKYQDLFKERADLLGDWNDIASTAAVGRDHFRHRMALVARDREEASDFLEQWLSLPAASPLVIPSGLTFCFTGQGSERSGMGLGLLSRSAVFRLSVARMDAVLSTTSDRSLETIWANEHGELTQARYVQPALYGYGVALSELWRSWGVEPQAVLGHSLGEYIAATVAGVMTAEEGIRLVASRGRLTDELAEPGGMLTLSAGPPEVEHLLASTNLSLTLSVAAVNGPSNIVVSGPQKSIEKLEGHLSMTGHRYKRLRTTHGFHSTALDRMLDQFEAEAAKIEYREPEIRLISNVTGEEITRRTPIDASYWRQHLRNTVQFERCVSVASTSNENIFLEIGPDPQLLALLEGNGVENDRLVASIPKGGAEDEWHKLLGAAATLYTRGVDLNWKAVGHNQPFQKISLPFYPFQRQRFWFDNGLSQRDKDSHSFLSRKGPTLSDEEPNGTHPLLQTRLRTRGEPVIFQSRLSLSDPGRLSEHVVLGQTIVPGAAYLEMALSAASMNNSQAIWELSDIEFREACIFDEPRLLETVIHPATDDDARLRFEIASTPYGFDKTESNADWSLHANGYLEETSSEAEDREVRDLEAIRIQTDKQWDHGAFYSRFDRIGLDFGPSFRPVTDARGGATHGIVEFDFSPAILEQASRYRVHPVMLDACLQAAASLSSLAHFSMPALPVSLKSLKIVGEVDKLHFAHARLVRRSDRSLTIDVTGLDAAGCPILLLKSLTLAEVQHDDLMGWLHDVVWEDFSLPIPLSIEKASIDRRLLIVTSERDARPRGIAEAIANRAKSLGMHSAVASAAQSDRLALLNAFQRKDNGGRIDQPGQGSSTRLEIFYLPAIELPALSADHSGAAALAWQERVLGGALSWARELIASDKSIQCRLWLLSSGAFGPIVKAPEGVTLGAFSRSVRCEIPEMQIVAVDLEPALTSPSSHQSTDEQTAMQVDQLWLLLMQKQLAGTQYCIRDNMVLSPRLSTLRLPPRRIAGTDANLDTTEETQTGRLYYPGTGSLDDLLPTNEMRRAPAKFEIEIKVKATAINFHEVLTALHSDSNHEAAPGGECAAVIVRVGEGIKDLSVGDEVVAIGSGLMADFATLTRERLWLRPGSVTAPEAATLLIPFLTARWCFERVAFLQAGETVLVHAGAGGVGLAAIQEARRLGAIVFATAGSAVKRSYLMEIGVKDVFDSRSINFEQGVLEATEMHGVDVVLNSLSGSKIEAGLRCLSRGGRFIELGDREILSDADAGNLRPDVSYHRVHLRDALRDASPDIRTVIETVLEDVSHGILKPLRHHQFPLAKAGEAFRFMAAGHHIGRVLLVPEYESHTKPTNFPGVRSDAAYVVTGGFTGLGQLLVEELVSKSAGYVLALGRREPSAEAKMRFAQFTGPETIVSCVQCDVSDELALAEALRSIPSKFRLRGVFHAAGILNDASLQQQTADKFNSVLPAKVAGAWNLHRLTLSVDLDCFVLFSSAAAVFGGRGQSNHAAANAYLDGLAHFRRERLGLTALSINWGVWSETGAAVGREVAERSKRMGVSSISSARGLNILWRLIEERLTQVLVSKVNWQQWSRQAKPEAGANSDLLRNLVSDESRESMRIGRSNRSQAATLTEKAIPLPRRTLREELLAVADAQRFSVLESRLEARVRTVLSLPGRQSIDAARPLQEYGLDSLLSIELRNLLSADVGRKLPATTLFDYPTLASLTRWLYFDLLQLEESSKAIAPDPTQFQAGEVLIKDVASLSDEEVEKLFQEKMAGIQT